MATIWHSYCWVCWVLVFHDWWPTGKLPRNFSNILVWRAIFGSQHTCAWKPLLFSVRWLWEITPWNSSCIAWTPEGTNWPWQSWEYRYSLTLLRVIFGSSLSQSASLTHSTNPMAFVCSLPPNRYTIDSPEHNAYNIFLRLEHSPQLAKSNQVNVCVLGYLLLYAPTDHGRGHLANEILLCQGIDAVYALGKLYKLHLLPVCEYLSTYLSPLSDKITVSKSRGPSMICSVTLFSWLTFRWSAT